MIHTRLHYLAKLLNSLLFKIKIFQEFDTIIYIYIFKILTSMNN